MQFETQSLIARIAAALNIAAGPRFFEVLASHIAETMEACYVVVAETVGGQETVIACFGELPAAPQSYRTLPLSGADGRTLGTITLQFDRPPHPDQGCEDALKIFAARAAAEIERKQTEEALRESERRYKEFIAHSMEGVWRVDFRPAVPLDLSEAEIIDRMLHDGVIVEVNDALVRMNHIPDVKSTIGSKMIQAPDLEARIANFRRQVRAGFRTLTVQFPTHTHSGQPVWLEQLQVPIVEDGKLVQVWGISRDITANKLAEEELRQAEERYHGLFEAAGEAILVSQDAVVDCNSRTLRLLGATREQILNHRAWDYSPEFQPDGARSRDLVEEHTRLALQGITTTFDWEYRRPDGSAFDGHVTLSPVMIAGVPHRVALIRDITERKRAERQIQELNTELERLVAQRTKQLESANRELEAFTYSVSHDVRAAIRGIHACSKIVMDDYSERLNGEGTRLLASVSEDSRRLDRVAESLLDLSRLGRARMHLEELDISAMAWSVARSLSAAEPARQVRFHIADGMSATADQVLIRVVLEHLLGNAWKFTRNREIAEIEVGVQDSDESHTTFFVRDNGVGFDSAKAGQLFAAFERLHSDEEFEGTGIGLATVRRLIHRHGGKVWAEGNEGRGAIVFLMLPGPNDG